MVTAVLFIGVLNIAIGFAFAVFAGRTLVARGERPFELVLDTPAEEKAPQPERKTVVYEPPPDDATLHDVPKDWLDALSGNSKKAETFVEAAVEVLRLEVGKYRATMIEIDKRVRQCIDEPDDEVLTACLAELKATNEDWLGQQQNAVTHLEARQGKLGDFETVGSGLEDVLLDQAAQIETTCSNIDMLDFQTDLQAGCRRLITETRKLLDMAHTLRDRMHESMIEIMKANDSLADLDKQLQFDGMSKLYNRSGLERVIHDMWKDDPNRTRQISIGMLDIDRFAQINEEYGVPLGDSILSATGSLLDDMVRDDRSFDIVSRFSGQRFLVLFGDTGPRAATSTVERMRQTIGASTFQFGGYEIELTVSAAIVEVCSDDTSATLFTRAEKTLRAAKRNGRNQSYMHNGKEAVVVEPPEFEIKGQMVRLD
ncbi:MAG: GGDEF domain-containing protein [Planctomycetes bacterium]|nr:GGDEF domain-containing protein [Planctomycetota bacterium]